MGKRKQSDLNRPEGNDLQSNYQLHDTGETHLRAKLGQQGYYVADWGIDQRDDTSDELTYDDKLDYIIFDGAQMRSLVDLKTKSNDEWMGKYNTRHFAKYLDRAWEFGIPTWVYMGLTDDDAIVQDAFIPVSTSVWDEYCRVQAGNHESYESDEHMTFVRDNVKEHPHVQGEFQARDGNWVTHFDADCFRDWPEFLYSVGEVSPTL